METEDMQEISIKLIRINHRNKPLGKADLRAFVPPKNLSVKL